MQRAIAWHVWLELTPGASAASFIGRRSGRRYVDGMRWISIRSIIARSLATAPSFMPTSFRVCKGRATLASAEKWLLSLSRFCSQCNADLAGAKEKRSVFLALSELPGYDRGVTTVRGYLPIWPGRLPNTRASQRSGGSRPLRATGRISGTVLSSNGCDDGPAPSGNRAMSLLGQEGISLCGAS